MKQFLLVALLGLLSFGASAHRTGNGRNHNHGYRQYTPYHHRMEFMGPGGRGWGRHDRSYGYQKRYHGNGHNRGRSNYWAKNRPNQIAPGYNDNRGGGGYNQNNNGQGQVDNSQRFGKGNRR